MPGPTHHTNGTDSEEMGSARPLRLELLSAHRLSDEARGIAATQRWTTASPPPTTPLIAWTEKAAASLAADNATLARSTQAGLAASPAGEWLLDNYYLVEEQVLLVREDLPAHYGVELPRLTAGALAGAPRLYEAIRYFVAHTDSRFDESLLTSFIDGFQDVSALTIGEVWAVPIMLRIALIDNLSRLSAVATAIHLAEASADSWGERLVLAAQDDPGQVGRLLDELDRDVQARGAAFHLRFAQRLAAIETGDAHINTWLEQRLAREGLSLHDAHAQLQQEQASDQVSIANAITSIRFLDAYEWREFFERVSLVEHALRNDPAGVYSRMEFTSRDRYRHALEQMAKRCDLTELQLAEKTVALAAAARTANPADAVSAHVGWWLISEGRYQLEREVGYAPTARERLYRGPLRAKGLLYGGSLAVLTALLLWGLAAYAGWQGAVLWQVVVLVVMGVVPLSEIALSVVNRVSAFVYPPRTLPKLDFELPVADEHRTLVVVPALLSGVGATRSVIENLEVAYLANRDANVGFALLGDLRGSSEPTRPDDDEIVEAAVLGVSELNARYEAEHGVRPFHLLIRERRLNEQDGSWMGWERKRGSLVELVREMREEGERTFVTLMGDEQFRRATTFVITLDADTILPRDAARRLVGTIAHPLNRAHVEPGSRRVRRGYGLVQPRVGMSLPGSRTSRFAALYSGVPGIDPYANAISDTYQDVFGEGSFTGKGIFEVDVFHGVLEGLFPDNSLLSHDLVEGSFVRTALASDVEVLDDYPSNYLAAASRLHRWVRGDWQTLPFLGRRIRIADGSVIANPLSGLHRWKIIDNLRRSLVAPSTLLLFTAGWLLLGGPALAWPLVLLLVVLFPAYFSLADSMVFRPRDVRLGAYAPDVVRDFGVDTQRGLLSLAVLPHQALLMTDAVIRALWRRFVSRSKLLEWETAADAQKRAGTTPDAFIRAMMAPVTIAAGVLVVAAGLQPVRALAALPLFALWIAGPFLAWRVSLPLPEREPDGLSAEQRTQLRRAARKTWRFFDVFVTSHGHHLAPDNYQEDPGSRVAWRTSPTNIGLQLISGLSAYDLGYIALPKLIERSSDTLSAMAGLERYRGHFYNWYDITTLEPLRPAYISTVDSGNLAGHLLALRVGLLEASESPLLGPQLIDGALDAVRLAHEEIEGYKGLLGPAGAVTRTRSALVTLERALAGAKPPTELAGWLDLLSDLELLLHEVEIACDQCVEPQPAEDMHPLPTLAGRPTTEPVVPATPLENLRASVADAHHAIREPLALLNRLAPWASMLRNPAPSIAHRPALEPLLTYTPSLVGLAEGLVEALGELDDIAVTMGEPVASWAAQLAEKIRAGRGEAIELLARLRLDADIAREMWEHTDFRMLYDPQRHLFSIGYNMAEGRLDPSYYDLLASECRLASFLAIAKGDVTQEHWFRLGRSLTGTPDGRALVSWSASMFEYLMPLLVMKDWPGTLLSETYDTVVRRQISYGTERQVPWGVSESAFFAKDPELTYQYQAFGVPGLGLKRGLSADVVVAPYASVLALPVEPVAVAHNLRAFSAEGGEGRYGFYEALDYTPGRAPAGHTRGVVKAYFAHHQGMSFVTIANQLHSCRMQERFHADPTVASAELLLQERVPRGVVLVSPHVEEVKEVRSVRELPPPVTRSYPTADTIVPSTHFLSNGRYSVMVTNGGGGYSRCDGLSVTRYREDVTRDLWGTHFYVRDTDSGKVISAPHNPYPATPDEYHVTFSPEKAEYWRVDGDLETRVEVVVSPEDDVEVRRLAFTNRGTESRQLEVTSYFEIALTSQGADQAHKSFSNLFVQTEALPDTHAMLFTRRPRSAAERRIWGVHLVACETAACEWSFETDRAAFLGRLRGADDPVAIARGGMLGNSQGAVLDPCCALRRTVDVEPGQTVRIVFATGIAGTRDAAVRLSEKYHDINSAQRAIDLAWTAAQLELRDLGISPAEAVTLERLASRLLLTEPHSRLKIKTPAENGLPLSGLWSLGISGDHPILLVRVEEIEHAPLVRQALLAHQYWRHKGLVADLVIVNTRPSGYSDELEDRLRLLVRTGHALQMLDRPGGVFLRRADQMHPDVYNLLLSVARATLDGDGGSIALQLSQRGVHPAPEGDFMASRGRERHPAKPFVRPELLFDNGTGGFDPATGEYVIVLEGGETTPAPWINVLANPEFGCTVSEAGVGCTWALNSHENRITTWNNDPVTDGSGEAIYIRDEETGEFWSPTPLPVRTPEPYVVRHGHGLTTFEHHTHGIDHRLEWFVSPDKPVRVCRLELHNTGDRARTLSVTQLVEWVLGDSRSKAQQLVVTWYDAQTQALTAHNHYNADFPGRCAFVACDRPLHSWTASRTEFVGRNGRASDPEAMRRARLGSQSGRYHDNCGALMTRVEIEPGATASVSFLLGQTATLDESRELVESLRIRGAITAEKTRATGFWDDLLGTVEVATPSPQLDLLVNGRLLYQATACRLWGRTATYQSSGAFGFRDQLQDVLALLTVRPDLVRAQIIEAARHQFPEGDVQHWWQPYSGRGVRTHITDDRHWLPLVVAEYLEATGDTGVLDEQVPFVEGPPLDPGAEDAYLQPTVSHYTASIYEHCLRAIETGRPLGAHGLPLMGGGDWNDGMNRVGHEGTGESVWLAWFLGHVLTRFAPVCESRGESQRATEFRTWASSLASAAEKTAWDGAWYRRAYFDDGTPLGTATSAECRIDAIAQAWATISGLGDPARATQALASVDELLVDRDAGLIALLAPPFDRMDHDPGYIKGYVPGVRENGGQYTHAALWTVLAHLLRGDGDTAMELLDLINPVNHALDAQSAVRYKVEPYVVAADVYAVDPHVGRGGWTWYTGSASWFYRVALRWLLGFHVVAGVGGGSELAIDPCIPATWPRFSVAYRHGGATYRIHVENPQGMCRGVARVELDGVAVEGGRVALGDDGREHEVRVVLG